MKVYQIISEAPGGTPPPQKASARLQAMQANAQARRAAAMPPAAPAAPLTTAQKAAARAAKTGANIQKLDQLKGKGAVGDARVAYSQLVQKLKGRAAVKDIYDTAKNAKSALGAAKLETFMKNVGGPIGMFVKAVDLYAIIQEYYNVVGSIEEAYKNGDLSNDEAESAGIFKSYISQVNGVLTAKLAVWFVHAKTSFNIAKWIARIVRWVAGGTTTLATGGIGLAAVVASEAFFIWLERFLDSDAGRDWLLNGYIGMAIIGLGKVEGSVWDSLTGYYTNQAKDKTTVQNKKALDTATTPADKAAAQQTIDTAKATQDRSDDIDALQKKLK
jgi:hypothetical protein